MTARAAMQVACIAGIVAPSLVVWLSNATFAYGAMPGLCMRAISAACIVAVLCVVRRTDSLSESGERKIALCVLCIPAGCMLLAVGLALQGVAGLALLACGYTSAGVGQGAALFAGALRMAALGAPEHGKLFSAGSLVGVVLAACAVFVPVNPPAAFALCALVSAAAFVVLRACGTDASARMQDRRYTDTSIIKFRTSLAISSQTAIVGTLILCVNAAYYQALPFALAGGALGCLVELVCHLVNANAKLSPAAVQRGCVGLFILSALLYDFLYAVGHAAAGLDAFVFCCSAALSLLFVFNFNTLVMEAREFSLEYCVHFGRGFLGVWAGVFAGAVLVALLAALLAHVPAGTMGFWLATFLVVVLLVVGFVCKPDESEDFEVLQATMFQGGAAAAAASHSHDEQSSVAQRCQVVAARFGLTPRETEVLELLAHGRNAKYVQEKLVVSLSTAKTHIYHIYQKLQVNSQQQVLDLIDNAFDLRE